jgi:glycosyltransferase involved in cell wall biosynthesis
VKPVEAAWRHFDRGESQREQMIDQKFPALSVVAIGRNEGVRLKRCLDSVRRMHFPSANLQLIYVDTASTDDSVHIAEACGASVIVIGPDRPCAAKARNAGWRAASAPFILFLDGDTVLDPDFVARAIGVFEDPLVVVACGRRSEVHPEQSIYTRVLDLDWSAMPAGESSHCGGDALMRRSVLEETGGFDDELIAGEEPELCWRIRARGHKILTLDIPMTGHDLGMTRWRQYWKRAVRTGHAYAEIAERFRATPDPLWHAEQSRNVVQGVSYSLLWLGAGVASLVMKSPGPVGAALVVFLALAFRTALRTRNRNASPALLFAYGLHSHLQQIPVLAGQLEYWLSCLRGRRRSLIEYHERAH